MIKKEQFTHTNYDNIIKTYKKGIKSLLSNYDNNNIVNNLSWNNLILKQY
jgi:hypothetical protein